MKKFTIFSGTHSWEEWWQACKDYFNFSLNYEDTGKIVEFEKAFSRVTETKDAISFGAGRMALYAILEALELQPGDEIIIPAFTCVVVPNAMIYRGLKPVYVDIDPVTFNIDASKVERAITARTKALYMQHTFGVLCNVAELKRMAAQHHLCLIEDAAHALGACYGGQKAGGLSDVAFFSTDHSKVISTGLGGMVTTNNDGIARKVRAIQQKTPFLPRQLVRKILLTFIAEKFLFFPLFFRYSRKIHSLLVRLRCLFYFQDELKTIKPDSYPYPCRLSSVQAKIGLSQLSGLQTNLAHRRKISEWLEERIRWYQFTDQQIAEQSWLRYSFLVKDRASFEKNHDRQFDLGVWFTSVVHGRTTGLDKVGYEANSCPVAEEAARHIVNFPTHLNIPLSVVQQCWNRNQGLLEIKK